MVGTNEARNRKLDVSTRVEQAKRGGESGSLRFGIKKLSDHPDQHREFLDWAVALRGTSSVTFGEGNQFPSWSFIVCLPSGKHVTLFGMYPDDTIWLQPQSLPDPLGALYRESLKSVVDEREFTKQWFYRKNAIQDLSFIGTLKRAVQKVLGAQQPGSSF